MPSYLVNHFPPALLSALHCPFLALHSLALCYLLPAFCLLLALYFPVDLSSPLALCALLALHCSLGVPHSPSIICLLPPLPILQDILFLPLLILLVDALHSPLVLHSLPITLHSLLVLHNPVVPEAVRLPLLVFFFFFPLSSLVATGGLLVY